MSMSPLQGCIQDEDSLISYNKKKAIISEEIIETLRFIIEKYEGRNIPNADVQALAKTSNFPLTHSEGLSAAIASLLKGINI